MKANDMVADHLVIKHFSLVAVCNAATWKGKLRHVLSRRPCLRNAVLVKLTVQKTFLIWQRGLLLFMVCKTS